MKNSEFLKKLKMAVNVNTMYVLGGFGLVLNANGKERAINSYEYNKNRAEMIKAANNNTFGFDCSGLIKGILWGFNAETSLPYGGAIYRSNNVPDINADSMVKLLINRDYDMSQGAIAPGEMLYMTGHCGIYIGNGEVIECTPKWANCVQIRQLTDRKWLCHGKLPWVDYNENPTLDSVDFDGVADILSDIEYSVSVAKELLAELKEKLK